MPPHLIHRSTLRLRRLTVTLLFACPLFISSVQAEDADTEELLAAIRSMQALIEQQNDRIAALEAKLAPPQTQPDTSSAKARHVPRHPAHPSPPPAAPLSTTPAAPDARAQALAKQLPPALVSRHRQAANRSLIEDMDTMFDQQRAAARLNNAPLNSALKGFFPVPGTASILRIGGSARFDMITDSTNAGNDNLFQPSSIPLPGEMGDFGSGESAIHTKGTRLSAELRRVSQDDHILRIFSEFDFYGDSNSNAMNFRTRHFYGQVWNLLVGQTFSSFMDIDAWPDVVDYQGPNAMVNRRQAQIRYTHPWIDEADRRFFSFVSAEQSDQRIDTLNGGPMSPSTTVSQLPDFVVGARYEEGGWHCQLSTLWRHLGVESNSGFDDDALGWGVSAATSFPVLGNDRCFAQATYGEGIARYLNDLGGQNLDAVVIGDNLETVPVFAAMLGYTHRWNDRWRSTVTGGYVHVDSPDALGPSALDSTLYASANLMWHPTPSFRTGFEYLYGQKQNLGGQEADAHRLNFVIRYDLVR